MSEFVPEVPMEDEAFKVADEEYQEMMRNNARPSSSGMPTPDPDGPPIAKEE